MAISQRRPQQQQQQAMGRWPVARWQPVPANELDQMSDRLRRMIEETFGALPQVVQEVAAWVPAVDIRETEDAYVIEAELPGAEPEDVNIELTGNELSITGEIKDAEDEGTVRRRGRRRGRFEFHVTLPNEVDGDNINADFENGVLSVRVPKMERAQHRRIEIGDSQRSGSKSSRGRRSSKSGSDGGGSAESGTGSSTGSGSAA
jgi:HSP20 family protein